MVQEAHGSDRITTCPRPTPQPADPQVLSLEAPHLPRPHGSTSLTAPCREHSPPALTQGQHIRRSWGTRSGSAARPDPGMDRCNRWSTGSRREGQPGGLREAPITGLELGAHGGSWYAGDHQGEAPSAALQPPTLTSASAVLRPFRPTLPEAQPCALPEPAGARLWAR